MERLITESDVAWALRWLMEADGCGCEMCREAGRVLAEAGVEEALSDAE